jgi:hypothetical protein
LVRGLEGFGAGALDAGEGLFERGEKGAEADPAMVLPIEGAAGFAFGEAQGEHGAGGAPAFAQGLDESGRHVEIEAAFLGEEFDVGDAVAIAGQEGQHGVVPSLHGVNDGGDEGGHLPEPGRGIEAVPGFVDFIGVAPRHHDARLAPGLSVWEGAQIDAKGGPARQGAIEEVDGKI